jgi:hypothetical protein
MSALSDKIKSDLVKLSKSDKHLQSIIKRLESGKANLTDVDDFAQATGTVLKKVFEKSITESPKAFTDEQLIAEILGDIFGDNYDLINSVAENIQKQLDKAAGIGIKPQRADFPSERIENLAKVTAQKDLTDKTALSEFTASVENINGSIFTDYVKTNADFRSKAGLKVYVIRSDHSKCCAWCSKLAGKYVYPDVPKDVWRRHKRCTCEITYVNEKAGTYDQISYSDVQNGKEIETRKQVTRLTPEQARAKEKEVLSRIDKSRKNGIIEVDKDTLKEYLGKPITQADSQHVREWYYANVTDIPNQIDKTKPFEEQVKQAFELRNYYKHEARVAMSDKKTAMMLDEKRPAPTFEKLLKDKMKRKNMTKDEALKDILETASKTNDEVNKNYGL